MNNIEALEIVLRIALDSLEGTTDEHLEQLCGSWENGAHAIALIERLHESMKGDE